MPHDGQHSPADTASTLLPGLLDLTRAALGPVEAYARAATAAVRAQVTEGDRVSGRLIEAHQDAAHGLAWVATYAEGLREMQGWAERLAAEGRFGEIEALIHQIAFGEYIAQLAGGLPMSQGEIVRPADLGMDAALLDTPEMADCAARAIPPRRGCGWRNCWNSSRGWRVSAPPALTKRWR